MAHTGNGAILAPLWRSRLLFCTQVFILPVSLYPCCCCFLEHSRGRRNELFEKTIVAPSAVDDECLPPRRAAGWLAVCIGDTHASEHRSLPSRPVHAGIFAQQISLTRTSGFFGSSACLCLSQLSECAMHLHTAGIREAYGSLLATSETVRRFSERRSIFLFFAATLASWWSP